ncbi:vacuolar protein sorting-associated protein 11 homolog [Glossina fuscipes]|uniref:Vacuolar protein sorting-associated protein 11 homolog n=1 Tax=Glossina fuscipes TaxID=7396 RepID=A0A9C5ZEV4_9MUSC|nr:vacuolar protein sorting-associated protein 11 homolog [Glossina fuscipes]
MCMEWKLVDFFKLCHVNTPNKNLRNNELIAVCHNGTYNIFCDSKSGIYVFSTDWDCKYFNTANESVDCCTITETNFFIMLEQSLVTHNINLKIYNLNKIFKGEQVQLVGIAQLECCHEVTVLKAFMTDSYLFIAIGLDKGNVLLHDANVSRDMTTNFRKLHVCTRPIKGIDFFLSNYDETNMFVCTDGGIFCFSLSKNKRELKVVLDNESALVHCCTVQALQNEHYFVVGRDDALYCYTADGRGPCYAIDGRKKILKSFGKYLIVVLEQSKPKPMSYSSRLVIIDIENKIIVFSQEIETVEAVLPKDCYANCYIVLKNKSVLTLRERQIKTKLRLLLDKSLYDFAFQLLNSLDLNSRTLADIYVRYGDCMLLRGDINKAVAMYIHTIGEVLPFKIIMKLIDLKYKEHLIKYLQAVTKTKYGSQDHEELLRNCYKRLNLPVKVKNLFELNLQKNDQIGYLVINREVSNLNALSKVVFDMDKKEVFNFFKKYAGSLIIQYPKDVHEAITTLSLKMSCEPIIQYLLPIFLKDDECCLKLLHMSSSNGNLKAIYSIWLELLLRKWQCSEIDVSKVLDFFQVYKEYLIDADVLIICRQYKFWKGIMLMHDKDDLNFLKIQYFLRNYNDPTEHKLDIMAFNRYHELWLHVLSKKNVSFRQPFEFTNIIFKALVRSSVDNTLKSIKCLSTNTNFSVAHVNDIFTQDRIPDLFPNSKLKHILIALNLKLGELKNLLADFLKKPIEFRGSVCEICKQPIKLPIVQFLCEHTFHKACLNSYPERNECISCLPAATVKSTKRRPLSEELLDDGNGGLKTVACAIQEGIFYKNDIEDKTNPMKWIWKNDDNYMHNRSINTNNTNVKMTNPFQDMTRIADKEYDTNLNPFNEN